MTPVWRWIMAMGFSVFMIVAGLITLWQAGESFALYGWFILGLGVLSLGVNFVMRKQLF
jgi:hypothetical protein